MHLYKNIINNKYHSLNNLSASFRNEKPFPHIVLDNFLDADIFGSLKKTIDQYSANKRTGILFNSNAEMNKWISLNSNLPNDISHIVETLNDKLWLSNLLELTGLNSLNTTSHGNTKLANYHEMEPGGILVTHVDHSSEPLSGMPHVLNIIIFLSQEWDPSYGGATLFWDQWGKKIVKKIEYKPNRAVIFLHTPYSFHSVEYINPNHKFVRRTIYIDYYSNSFDPYTGINLDFSNKWFKHGTTFKLNKLIDYFKLGNSHYTKALLMYNLRKILS